MLTVRFRCVLVALQAVTFASAQALSESVWAVFAYTLDGDSTPTALPRPKTLTPYGASELYAAGSAFRDRYVALDSEGVSEHTRIQNLSPYVLDSEELSILSTADQSTIASAQAFMQGLYPPLAESSNSTYIDSSSILANGSVAMAPFQGYQYPRIAALSTDDPRSVAISGQSQCPQRQAAISEYQSSEEFQRITRETEMFYIILYDQALSGIYSRSSATYKNAVDIAEYLEYELLHNETLLHAIDKDDIDQARHLADRYLSATNGNTTGQIPVGGRTLASLVMDTFKANIHYRGGYKKMTLTFGGPEPVIALASLTKLASRYGNIYPRPALGASIIFELYSLENETYPTYPDPSELYVRFLLHNGTDTSTSFTTYPLFGHGPSSIAMPYSEFSMEMEDRSIKSIEHWCAGCVSSAVFCTSTVDRTHNAPTHNSTMDPMVAGGIGAVVTIAAIALIAVAIGLLVGFKQKRKSSGGGFKGDRKLASDTDVTFRNPVWGDNHEDGNQKSDGNMSGGIVVRGQERTGSWEMGNKERNAASPTEGDWSLRSPFDDENEVDWLVHSEPAKAHETV